MLLGSLPCMHTIYYIVNIVFQEGKEFCGAAVVKPEPPARDFEVNKEWAWNVERFDSGWWKKRYLTDSGDGYVMKKTTIS